MDICTQVGRLIEFAHGNGFATGARPWAHLFAALCCGRDHSG